MLQCRFIESWALVCSRSFILEVILAHELRRRGLRVDRQLPVLIACKGVRFDEGFRLDLLVENKVIIELKCVEALNSAHEKQVLTYLRLSDKRLGYLLNFFSDAHMKNGIVRSLSPLTIFVLFFCSVLLGSLRLGERYSSSYFFSASPARNFRASTLTCFGDIRASAANRRGRGASPSGSRGSSRCATGRPGGLAAHEPAAVAFVTVEVGEHEPRSCRASFGFICASMSRGIQKISGAVSVGLSFQLT